MQLTKWAGKVPYLLLLKCSMDEALKDGLSIQCSPAELFGAYSLSVWNHAVKYSAVSYSKFCVVMPRGVKNVAIK